jgi:hypothetical protein
MFSFQCNRRKNCQESLNSHIGSVYCSRLVLGKPHRQAWKLVQEYCRIFFSVGLKSSSLTVVDLGQCFPELELWHPRGL